MRIILIINIILRLALGGMMLYGGIQKFQKPIPAPTLMLEEIKSGKEPKPETLQIRNYIFGMKQTNYFWQFLGIVELAVGLLLLSQIFGFVGSVLAAPLTVNIFLFHLFLEPHEVGELLQVTGLLLANIWLIGIEFPRWRSLVRNAVWQ